MKDFRLFAVMLVAALMVVAGCDRQAGKVDTSDPEAVARAFFVAIADNNVEEALQYVEPGDERVNSRIDFERRGLPSIPKEANIIVEVNGDEAEAILNANTGLGCDLRRRDGRWWIVK